MSSLFSSLNTGYSGLKASELNVATTSHNIANADNPNYTRQRVQLEASVATDSRLGNLGTGVDVQAVIRIHDEFTYARLRDASGDLAYAQYEQRTLEEVAKYFPDLDSVGIAKDLQEYFGAWNDVATNPDDVAQKIALAQYTSTLTQNISATVDTLKKVQENLDEDLTIKVNEINRLTKGIAEVNKQIGMVETVDQTRANDLRDQRDQYETALAKLVDISVFKGQLEQQSDVDTHITDQGREYYLNIGGYSIVDGANYHELTASTIGNDSRFHSLYYTRQDGETFDMTGLVNGGEVGAIIDLRGDVIDKQTQQPITGKIQTYIDKLDSFSKSLIENTNNIYAASAQTSMNSNVIGLKEDDYVLTASDNIKSGSFDVVVYGTTGEEISRRTIDVGITSTLKSIEDAINETYQDDNDDLDTTNDVDDYFQASYGIRDGEGIFTLNPTSAGLGYKVAIEDNGTNFAGALGLSRFFDGTDGSDISLNSQLQKDPSAIHANKTPVSGNNELANAMIQLQYDKVEFRLEDDKVVNETFNGFYRFLTTDISSDTQASGSMAESFSAVYNSVYAEHQSISGVNMDEELANLIKFQTSYGASAKVITTIDKMLDTMLGIKQ